MSHAQGNIFDDEHTRAHLKPTDASTRTWAAAVATLVVSASAHAIATPEPKVRMALDRTPSDLAVAVLEPAPVRGTLVENVSYAPGGVARSETLTQTVSAASSEFEHWSLWAGGLGMIVFVVRRRLGD